MNKTKRIIALVAFSAFVLSGCDRCKDKLKDNSRYCLDNPKSVCCKQKTGARNEKTYLLKKRLTCAHVNGNHGDWTADYDTEGKSCKEARRRWNDYKETRNGDVCEYDKGSTWYTESTETVKWTSSNANVIPCS